MHNYFVKSLGDSVITSRFEDNKPFEVDMKLPKRSLRVYLFNLTRPPGGRPLGECKIQLIISGQKRGERASFDFSDERFVVLAGYDKEYDSFVLWDAYLYPDFSYSRNVQVKVSALIGAAGSGISSQDRKISTGDETILVVGSQSLLKGIEKRQELHLKRIMAG